MRKKICFFSSSFGFNRQATLDILEKILPKDIEMYLFVPKNSQPIYSPKRSILVQNTSTKFSSFFSLRNFCRRKKIDRIINLGVLPQEELVMIFSSLFTNTDFVSNYIGNPLAFASGKLSRWSIKSFFETILFWFLSPFPKKILVCSKDITLFWKKFLPFFQKKIFHVPVPIDTELFSPKNKVLSRKKLGLPNKPTIIFVGRIEYLKGSDILLELIRRNPSKQFILIGKLNDSSFKKQELENLLLIDSKTSKELVYYYNSADLCIFPSRLESFGIVPREAMSCGVPAIVSDISALRTIEPAIKAFPSPEIFNREIEKYFNLPQKEKQTLSKLSRDFVIKECDYSLHKKYFTEKFAF